MWGWGQSSNDTQNKIAEPEIFPNDVEPPEAHDHSKPQPEKLWQCHGVIVFTLLHSTGRGAYRKQGQEETKPTYKILKSGLFALPITNKQNFPTILV